MNREVEEGQGEPATRRNETKSCENPNTLNAKRKEVALYQRKGPRRIHAPVLTSPLEGTNGTPSIGDGRLE